MPKVKITIKSIWGSVLYENEKPDYTLVAAIHDANLYDADLYGANLYGADLSDADLYGANLYGADLYGADLSAADLRRADLRRANLSDADLYGANLRRADLYDADLSGANLSDADLYGANLRRANLSGQPLDKLPQDYIDQCSRDIWFVLEHLKPEVPFLRDKLIAGEVDGTAYEGDCACLVGTLGKAVEQEDDLDSEEAITKVCSVIPYYRKGLHNPGEQWFWNIHKGDTPENNEFAAHAIKLIDMVLGEAK